MSFFKNYYNEWHVRKLWGQKKWRGISIESHAVYRRDEPIKMAENIAQKVSNTNFPVRIMLRKKIGDVGEDSSGKTVMWRFNMYIIWPAVTDDNKFINSYIKPALRVLDIENLPRLELNKSKQP